MISVDTNVLVRLVTNDDPAQAKQAARVLASGPILVTKTALLETEWVLRYSYRLGTEAIQRSLRSILGLPGVEPEAAVQVAQALDLCERGMDFADALHLASSDGAEKFVTFDRKLCSQTRRWRPPVAAVHP